MADVSCTIKNALEARKRTRMQVPDMLGRSGKRTNVVSELT
jgi:hypothetical protein